MTASDKFIAKLNQNPIIWTLTLGLAAYASSFIFAFITWVAGVPVVFELGFFVAGTLVVAYHFVMSRYQTSSTIAQVIQLFFAYVLVTLTTAIVGISTFQKGYAGLTNWLYSQ